MYHLILYIFITSIFITVCPIFLYKIKRDIIYYMFLAKITKKTIDFLNNILMIKVKKEPIVIKVINAMK